MKGHDKLMSKKDSSWNTPRDIVEILKSVIPISLDCASSKEHAVCEKYITPEMDETWTAVDETGLFLNPPYSPTKLCAKLVEKVIRQAQRYNTPAVILIPARTDTALWQDLIFPNCVVLYKKGRIKFLPSYKVYACDLETRLEYEVPPELNPATFPSAFCFVNVSSDKIVRIARSLRTSVESIVETINLSGLE